MRSVNMRAPRGLMTVCLLVVVLWGIAQARPFLIPLSISGLLALMMAPLVRMMRKHHFPEWSAILLSAVLLVLPFLSVATVLFLQGEALVKDYPRIVASLNRTITEFVESPYGQRLSLPQHIDILSVIEKMEGTAIHGIQFTIAGLGAVLGAGSQLVLVLLFGLLMLGSRRHLRSSCEEILVKVMSVRNPSILNDVVALIERFLIARLLIVILVAGVDIIILGAFGLHYSILLGSFLGVLTLLPAIGFIIGCLPPIIVALASGFSLIKTLALFIAIAVVSIIEGNILTPKMVGGSLNINALTAFIGLFAGGLIWGVWGMFLSIPTLGILRIIFDAAPSLRPWGDLLADKRGEPVIRYR